MQTIAIERCKQGPKSLILESGDKTFFAKKDSGLSAGMTIDAETEDTEYNGKTYTWVKKWKDAPNAAPTKSAPNNVAASTPYWLPFVSNVVAHAIQSGQITEPGQIIQWANTAKNWATGDQPPF